MQSRIYISAGSPFVESYYIETCVCGTCWIKGLYNVKEEEVALGDAQLTPRISSRRDNHAIAISKATTVKQMRRSLSEESVSLGVLYVSSPPASVLVLSFSRVMLER